MPYAVSDVACGDGYNPHNKRYIYQSVCRCRSRCRDSISIQEKEEYPQNMVAIILAAVVFLASPPIISPSASLPPHCARITCEQHTAGRYFAFQSTQIILPFN